MDVQSFIGHGPESEDQILVLLHLDSKATKARFQQMATDLASKGKLPQHTLQVGAPGDPGLLLVIPPTQSCDKVFKVLKT